MMYKQALETEPLSMNIVHEQFRMQWEIQYDIN